MLPTDCATPPGPSSPHASHIKVPGGGTPGVAEAQAQAPSPCPAPSARPRAARGPGAPLPGRHSTPSAYPLALPDPASSRRAVSCLTGQRPPHLRGHLSRVPRRRPPLPPIARHPGPTRPSPCAPALPPPLAAPCSAGSRSPSCARYSSSSLPSPPHLPRLASSPLGPRPPGARLGPFQPQSRSCRSS